MQAAGRSPVPTTVRLRRRMRRSLYRVPHALVDPPGRLRRGLHLERRSDRRQVISIWHSWQDDRGIRTPEQYRRRPREPSPSSSPLALLLPACFTVFTNSRSSVAIYYAVVSSAEVSCVEYMDLPVRHVTAIRSGSPISNEGPSLPQNQKLWVRPL